MSKSLIYVVEVAETNERRVVEASDAGRAISMALISEAGLLTQGGDPTSWWNLRARRVELVAEGSVLVAPCASPRACYLIKDDDGEETEEVIEAPSLAVAVATWRKQLLDAWKRDGCYGPGDEETMPASVRKLASGAAVRDVAGLLDAGPTPAEKARAAPVIGEVLAQVEQRVSGLEARVAELANAVDDVANGKPSYRALLHGLKDSHNELQRRLGALERQRRLASAEAQHARESLP